MTGDELKAIARREIEEIFSLGDLDLVDEIVSPDYIIFDNARLEPVRGRENLKAAVAGFRTAFPDFTVRVEEQICEGNTVVTRWTATGTHEGVVLGVAPTGRFVTMAGIDIEKFVDGQIAEVRTSWDALGLLQQLGAVDMVIDV